MNIDQLFKQQCLNGILNTSYPLYVSDWSTYERDGQLTYETEKESSFYIHIPFCDRLCNFCEYTRVKVPSDDKQFHYLIALQRDLQIFIQQHSSMKLRGFDIGGGTPTALSDNNFHFLLNDIYANAISSTNIQKADDFEPSIEATFQSLSTSKLKDIVSCGIRRLSLGIQSTSIDVLGNHNREGLTKDEMRLILDDIHQAGIRKINLDLMYGLKGQTMETLRSDIRVIENLRPEQVTLYELRPNMINYKAQSSAKERYDQYCLLYEMLIDLGYYSRFGQNTFSLSESDMGVSSYLRSRMLDGVSYRGFGLSAQSMNSKGIAYCIGKNGQKLHNTVLLDSFVEDNHYLLPPSELVSKYIAIAAYSGGFSLASASRILQQNASIYFKKQINYCLSEGLLCQMGDRLQVTKEGFLYYGAIFSLFFKKQHELLLDI